VNLQTDKNSHYLLYEPTLAVDPFSSSTLTNFSVSHSAEGITEFLTNLSGLPSE